MKTCTCNLCSWECMQIVQILLNGLLDICQHCLQLVDMLCTKLLSTGNWAWYHHTWWPHWDSFCVPFYWCTHLLFVHKYMKYVFKIHYLLVVSKWSTHLFIFFSGALYLWLMNYYIIPLLNNHLISRNHFLLIQR